MWTYWLVVGFQVAVLATLVALLARKLAPWKVVVAVCLWSWVSPLFYRHLADADRGRLAVRPTKLIAEAYQSPPGSLGYVSLPKATVGCTNPQAVAVASTVSSHSDTEAVSRYLVD